MNDFVHHDYLFHWVMMRYIHHLLLLLLLHVVVVVLVVVVDVE
jgi:hypothetical protein